MYEQVSISDIADVVTGKTPSTKDSGLWEPDIPFITPKDLQAAKHIATTDRRVSNAVKDRYSKQVVPAGSVCVSCIGNLGYVGVTEVTSLTNQQINTIVPHDPCDSDYLYYAMRWLWPYFKHLEGQSTTLSIVNKSQFKRISIPWPNQRLRQRISDILNRFDDMIELNLRTNDYLVDLATALFEKALDEETCLIPFGELAELEDSKRIPLNKQDREKRKGPYPYYGATSIMDYVDDYLFDGIRVLLGEDGSVMTDEGYPFLQYVWGKYWVNNHAHIIKAKSDYSLEAIYLALRRTVINHIVTGAVQMKISQKNLNGLELQMPNLTTIPDFGPFFAMYRHNTDEAKRLAKLRDILLPKMMSGEIDVSKISIHWEEDFE